jgi:hypothetical protein
VNGNWRVTFRFEEENAIVVDYRGTGGIAITLVR